MGTCKTGGSNYTPDVRRTVMGVWVLILEYFFDFLLLCVCIVIPFILDVRFVDVPEREFLHLPSSTVKYFQFCVRTIESFSTY